MSCEIKFSLDVVLMRDRLFCHSQSPLTSYFTNILAQSRPDKQMKYKFLVSVFKRLYKKSPGIVPDLLIFLFSTQSCLSNVVVWFVEVWQEEEIQQG